MIIALKAVWDSHDYHRKDGELDPIPNLYSFHSWVGITVVTTYCIQVIRLFNYFELMLAYLCLFCVAERMLLFLRRNKEV